jgi:hypothetical protein
VEIGAYIDYSRASGSDDGGTTYVLYRAAGPPVGGVVQSLREGLEPLARRGVGGETLAHDASRRYGDEEKKLAYETFSERDVRHLPELFAAAGTPNVRELA